MNVALLDNLRYSHRRPGHTSGRVREVSIVEAGKIRSIKKDIQKHYLDFIVIGLSEKKADINRRALKRAMKKSDGLIHRVCLQSRSWTDSFVSAAGCKGDS